MSQVEETFEFEAEMTEQVAGEVDLAEKVAETKASDPDQVEVETPEVEVETEPEVETTSAEKVEHGTLTGMMDEREKRQKAVALAEDLQKRLDAYETKPEDEVSIFEDEAGFKAQQDKKYQQDLRNSSLNMSQAFAEKEFGEERVTAATKWMQDDGVKSPYVVQQFNDAKLPFHKLVEIHEAELARINPDSQKEKWLAEYIEKHPQIATPEPDIKQSLASKGSAGEPSKLPDDPDDILGD